MATAVFGLGMAKKTYQYPTEVKGGKTVAECMENAFNAKTYGLPALLEKIKRKYLSRHSASSIASRKDEIRSKTHFTVTKVSENSVKGGIVIGDGVKYTPIHVGGPGATFMSARNRRFTVPLPHIRTNYGGVVGYKMGSLLQHPGLFRGNRGNLKRDVLYQRDLTDRTRITPMFKLKRTQAIPTRVNMDEVNDMLNVSLQTAMDRAFKGYDFGFLRKMQAK